MNDKTQLPPPPHFQMNNPQTDQQKLIVELTDDLVNVMKTFLLLNESTKSNIDLLIIIRDGTLAYSGIVMELLVNMLKDKNQKSEFIEEVRHVFNLYLKDIKKYKEIQ